MATRKTATRRGFLRTSGCAATAMIGGAVVAEAAGTTEPAPQVRPAKRKVISGSPSQAYSRAVRLGDLVFVAGCVGVDREGKIHASFETQAEQTLLNLKESIERSGSTLTNVLKCTCFLKEYEDFQTFNKVYLKFFPKDPPARSTVVVKDFVVAGAKLEVDCVCCID
ncbi:MAG: RidA family protein [Phycisphaerae bacterium]|nr:RidA family protein [Phycisphaerae bacterium]